MPNLVEDQTLDRTFDCAGCGKSFRPLRQTAKAIWSSPPVGPDPPPPLPRLPITNVLENDLSHPVNPNLLPGHQAGRTAQGFILLVLLLNFVNFLVMFGFWLIVLGNRNEELPGIMHLQDGAENTGGCCCLTVPIHLVGGVFFLIWFGHAYGNLTRLGVKGIGYHPAWAVASFFIPGVNVILPPIIMFELWKASSSRIKEQPWSDFMGSIQVNCWWTAWLISLFGLGVLFGLPFLTFWFPIGWKLESNFFIFALFFLVPIANITAGILLIRLIDQINRGQSQLYQNLKNQRGEEFEDS